MFVDMYGILLLEAYYFFLEHTTQRSPLIQQLNIPWHVMPNNPNSCFYIISLIPLKLFIPVLYTSVLRIPFIWYLLFFFSQQNRKLFILWSYKTNVFLRIIQRQICIEIFIAWTDSTFALELINVLTNGGLLFRVEGSDSWYSSVHWRHVRSHYKPADVA